MGKQEFLAQLRKGLSRVPLDDIEERLNFYSEMIDDRMQEGFSEEDAVHEIGYVDEIVSRIIVDIPLTDLVKEKIKPKRTLMTWEIVLLVLGFPVWFPLLFAAFAVILAFYITICSVIIALWAVEISFTGSAIVGIIMGIVFVLQGNGLAGIAMNGVGIVSAGVSIFLFFGCRKATKSILLFTKKIALVIKIFLSGRRRHNA